MEAVADSEITMKTTKTNGGEFAESKIFFTVDKMRMVGFNNSKDDEEATEVIFDLKQSEMTVINVDSKTYTVINKTSLEKLQSRMEAMNKKLEAQLAEMPPERAKMMREMMAGKMGGLNKPQKSSDREIKKTGKKSSVAGFECELIQVHLDNKIQREYCVTPWSKIKEGDDISSNMFRMNHFIKEMTRNIQRGGDQDGSSPFDDIKQLNGFPVIVREFKKGKIVETSQLVSITYNTIPEGFFSVPTGFRKQSMMGERH
jgi:hypothetical protein